MVSVEGSACFAMELSVRDGEELTLKLSTKALNNRNRVGMELERFLAVLLITALSLPVKDWSIVLQCSDAPPGSVLVKLNHAKRSLGL